MSDSIDRQAAIDALADYIHNADRVYSTGQLSDADCSDAAESVLGADALPSAQPERKKGKWIVLQHEIDNQSFDECKCSVCGAVEYFNVGWHKFNYCPNCGAEMERNNG